MIADSRDGVSPMLAGYAIPRTGEASIEGRFSCDLDVWVVDRPEGEVPIVLINHDLGQTSTETRVLTEQDDADFDLAVAISTTTNTKVTVESDDTDVSCSGLLEATTKTFAQLEGDDHTTTLEAFGPQGGADNGPWSLPIR